METLEQRQLLAVTILDSGFENPVQPDNAFEQVSGTGSGTLVGSQWALSGEAGITRNNSEFQSGGIPPPEGMQHDLIQATSTNPSGNTSEFSAGEEVIPPELTVTIAAALIAEDDGTAATTATVSRNTTTTSALTVTLTNGDDTEVSIPTTVTIPANASSVNFDIAAVDDDLLDGTQAVTIGAGAVGYVDADDSLDVLDHETLTISIAAAAIAENEGSQATTATVTRNNTDLCTDLVVTLTNGDDTEVSIPTTVTIPAHAWSVNFDIDAVDDGLLDGNQTVVIGVAAAGYVDAYDSLDVLDDETLSISFDATPIAFPGAEGAGAGAVGGRGGDVYYVTNLNDTGVGSLRDGIDTADGPRTIVFGIGGTIDLQSSLRIDNPYLTIAGQTAPGGGITLKRHELRIDNTHDIVVQYIRTRPGDLATAPNVYEPDSLGVKNSSNVMIDHVSASWSTDEVLSVTDGSENVTVQWSLITEALHNSNHNKGNHGYGSIIKGGDLTFHHNLYAHNRSRNPRPAAQGDDTRLDFVNNVIYNPRGRFGYGDGDSENPIYLNYVGNYGISGPDTTTSSLYYATSADTHIYQSGNLMDTDKDAARNGTDLGWDTFAGPETQEATRVNLRHVQTDTAAAAYQRVLDFAGASLVRDAVDLRILDDVVSQTGLLIDSQSQVGGWPSLSAGTMLPDGDLDGMPDAYELQLGLNVDDPNDRNGDLNGDGYTNLENYLHSLTALSPVPEPIPTIAENDGSQATTVTLTNGDDTEVSIPITVSIPAPAPDSFDVTDDDIATVLFDMALVEVPTTTAADGSVGTVPDSMTVVHEWQNYYLEVYAKLPPEINHRLTDVEFTLNYDETVVELGLNNIVAGCGLDSFNVTPAPNQLDISGTITNANSNLGVNSPFLIARIPANSSVVANVLGAYPAEGSANLPTMTNSQAGLDQVPVDVPGTNAANPGTNIQAVRYDINDNDRVDLLDLSMLVNAFGQSTTNDATAYRADFDKDGKVGLSDLSRLVKHFGYTQGDGKTIVFPIEFAPEPVSVLLEEQPVVDENLASFFVGQAVPDVMAEPVFNSRQAPPDLRENAFTIIPLFEPEPIVSKEQMSTNIAPLATPFELDTLRSVEDILLKIDDRLLELVATGNNPSSVQLSKHNQEDLTDDLFAHWGV